MAALLTSCSPCICSRLAVEDTGADNQSTSVERGSEQQRVVSVNNIYPTLI